MIKSEIAEKLGIDPELWKQATEDKEKEYGFDELKPAKNRYFSESELLPIFQEHHNKGYKSAQELSIPSHVDKSTEMISAEFGIQFETKPKTAAELAKKLLEKMKTSKNPDAEKLAELSKKLEEKDRIYAGEIEKMKNEFAAKNSEIRKLTAISRFTFSDIPEKNAIESAKAMAMLNSMYDLNIEGQIVEKQSGKVLENENGIAIKFEDFLPSFLQKYDFIKTEIPQGRAGHVATPSSYLGLKTLPEVIAFGENKGYKVGHSEMDTLVADWKLKTQKK